jgi:hypothetical protein
MKHLLYGVAVAAALAIAAPVWAQNPSGGNSVGTPGPNPGGPGLTPYNSGASNPPPAAAPAAPSAPAGMPPAASAPPPPNSAMPPTHRHARAMSHHMMHGMHRGPALAGDTTAQLNRDELARIQAGNTGNPPAPPPPAGPPGSPK